MYNQLLKIDKELSGELFIEETDKQVIAYGKLRTSFEEEIKKEIIEYLSKKYVNKLPTLEISFENKFLFLEKGVFIGSPHQEHSKDKDEITVLYSGMFPIKFIKDNQKIKLPNVKNKEKMNNSIRVMNFISPIILNKDLKIIDGQVRLELALENKIKNVPVVILSATEIQEDTLRLVLNRSAEFQRWNWEEVDDVVDNYPQIQPIVEPLGFFGRYVLPESFFADTVIQYEIDPFNPKQMAYDQEWGLAKWAEIRRKQMEDNLKAKKEQKKKKKPEKRKSLFDLKPQKEDFLETLDADEELAKFTEKWKHIAEDISAKKDEWSKERKEKLGQEWQIKNRSNKEVSKDTRKQFIKMLEDSGLFTDDDKTYIINNVIYYKNMSASEIRDSLDNGGIDEK